MLSQRTVLPLPALWTGGRQPTALPLSTVSAWRAVRQYGRQVGLQEGLTVHTFRKFVGTQVAAKHGLRAAQLTLGHKRLETTARFYVLEDALAGGLTDHLY
jgi:integrase